MSRRTISTSKVGKSKIIKPIVGKSKRSGKATKIVKKSTANKIAKQKAYTQAYYKKNSKILKKKALERYYAKK